MDRHDTNVWKKTIDAVVSLASLGEDFSRGNKSSLEDRRGKYYKLPSGNVVLDWTMKIGDDQTRYIDVLMPENPSSYNPIKDTATVLFCAERSLTTPKFKFDPPKDRWRVNHVEDRSFAGSWYDELLCEAEQHVTRR